jgi:hypothetical protein
MFTEDQIKQDPILEFFSFEHLREGPLKATSAMFAELASQIIHTLPRNAERTAALRKLLEGKDCAVRAALPLLKA